MLCCISDIDLYRKYHTASLLLQQNKEYVSVIYVFQITLQNCPTETGQLVFIYLCNSLFLFKALVEIKMKSFHL